MDFKLLSRNSLWALKRWNKRPKRPLMTNSITCCLGLDSKSKKGGTIISTFRFKSEDSSVYTKEVVYGWHHKQLENNHWRGMPRPKLLQRQTLNWTLELDFASWVFVNGQYMLYMVYRQLASRHVYVSVVSIVSIVKFVSSSRCMEDRIWMYIFGKHCQLTLVKRPWLYANGWYVLLLVALT
jgi:hypothetical protein